MEIKIKSMSYEECRADFFVNLIRHAENKIKYWKRQPGYRCEIEDNLSQAGAEMQYCQDALNALEKQTPQKPKLLDSGEFYSCPNCDIIIRKNEPSHGNIDIPRCKWCGQALDWGEGERDSNEQNY